MRYVKYIGPSHIRQITARDWQTVGLTGDTVVWSARNGFAVPLDQFTDDQLRKGIDNDPYLVLTGDEDDEFVPQPQTMDMTPGQLDQTAENPVDVVDMLEGGDNVSTARSDAPADTSGGAADGDTVNTTR